MAATSVTGKGIGSAEKKQNISSNIEKIIGPRIVYAACVVLNESGEFNINLPQLPGTISDYVIVATHNNTTSVSPIGASLSLMDNEIMINLKGPEGSIVNVMLCKAGLAI